MHGAVQSHRAHASRDIGLGGMKCWREKVEEMKEYTVKWLVLLPLAHTDQLFFGLHLLEGPG